MTINFESKPKSLTEEAEYINDVEDISYEDFISNSLYLRNRYQTSLEEHFENLKSLWLEETKLSSNVFMTLRHPAHLNIVKLGVEVLPMILQDLKDHETHWFYSLLIISNENPIKEESLGNIDSMIGDWLDWGKSKSLIK